ncbi:MAG: hypothetical protein PHH26_04120 [Candidatus Thermoplasmatota archaeon]|nr:hypothetical protein [Candidatus Thermoplasmatota archaeon]
MKNWVSLLAIGCALMALAPMSGCTILDSMFPEPFIWETITSESGDVDPSTANPFMPLSFEFTTHERAERLRFQFNVTLQGDPGTIADTGSGLIGMTITMIDPNENSTSYEFGTSNAYNMEYATIEPGTWTVEITCNNAGNYSIEIEQYKPKYEDYKSWQMWRK